MFFNDVYAAVVYAYDFKVYVELADVFKNSDEIKIYCAFADIFL